LLIFSLDGTLHQVHLNTINLTHPEKKARLATGFPDVSHFDLPIHPVKIGRSHYCMSNTTLYSLDDLKSFVYRKICEHHNLLYEASSTSETFLRRRSEVCGIMFHLRGPRRTLFTAIWEVEQNRVLFYGTNGTRYREISGIGLETLFDLLATRDESACQ